MDVPGENPLFADAPRTSWFLSYETIEMVREHHALWPWLADQLNELGVVTFDVEHEGVKKSFYLLPQQRGKFFIIDMYGPDKTDQPLPLVFNFHNLYLVGFQQRNRWFVFDDADMLGSGYEKLENKEYWRYLGFSGGYRGNMFTEVHLGIDEFAVVYDTLIKYHAYKDGKRTYVEKCCFRLMAGLCEAWRFPWWNDRVAAILSDYESSPVDHPGIIVNTFEDLFHSWDKLSERVLLGPFLFHTLPLLARFPEYALMIPAIDVLLRAVAKAVEGEEAQEAAGADEGEEAAGADEGEEAAASDEGEEAVEGEEAAGADEGGEEEEAAAGEEDQH